VADAGLGEVDESEGPLRLGQAAELHGAYRWIEHRLFELTGAWAAEAPLAEVQLHLDEVSGLHAWHAELWADRLPALDGVDHASLTRPLGPAVGPLLAALAGEGSELSGETEEDPDEPPVGAGSIRGVLQRLTGLYRVVVPRLIVSYDRHLVRTSPVTDGPTIRALRLVLRDQHESWQAGELLIQGLLERPHDAAVAAATQRRLESIVVGAGVRPGLLPWPTGSPH